MNIQAWITAESHWCDELDKNVNEVTLREFIHDCPKAFTPCEKCEHCKVKRTKVRSTYNPDMLAF